MAQLGSNYSLSISIIRVASEVMDHINWRKSSKFAPLILISFFIFRVGIELEVVDSCATNNGGCEHKCKHKSGEAVCSCRRGYLLQADNKTCFDVDECATQESCCSQECTNNPGGYTCGCRHGFLLNKDGCGCNGKY